MVRSQEAMDLTAPEYKIKVYNYRHVHPDRPTRFQSPQSLDIHAYHRIIVRQHGGKNDNNVSWQDVDSLAKDVEPPELVDVDAHGVILRDGPDNDQKAGDPVWINSSDNNLVPGRPTVHVVNLRTFRGMQVRLCDVAWKPDRRQNDRLLTLAGPLQLRSQPCRTELQTVIVQSIKEIKGVEIREMKMGELRKYLEFASEPHRAELFQIRKRLLMSAAPEPFEEIKPPPKRGASPRKGASKSTNSGDVKPRRRPSKRSESSSARGTPKPRSMCRTGSGSIARALPPSIAGDPYDFPADSLPVGAMSYALQSRSPSRSQHRGSSRSKSYSDVSCQTDDTHLITPPASDAAVDHADGERSVQEGPLQRHLKVFQSQTPTQLPYSVDAPRARSPSEATTVTQMVSGPLASQLAASPAPVYYTDSERRPSLDLSAACPVNHNERRPSGDSVSTYAVVHTAYVPNSYPVPYPQQPYPPGYIQVPPNVDRSVPDGWVNWAAMQVFPPVDTYAPALTPARSVSVSGSEWDSDWAPELADSSSSSSIANPSSQQVLWQPSDVVSHMGAQMGYAPALMLQGQQPAAMQCIQGQPAMQCTLGFDANGNWIGACDVHGLAGCGCFYGQ